MLRRGTQFLEPLSDGAEVALVTMMGSLNPVTRGHVQCFEAAREHTRARRGEAMLVGSATCHIGAEPRKQ